MHPRTITLSTLLVFMATSAALAQNDVEVSSSRQRTDTVRSQYIQSFPDHFFIWPVLKQRKLDFELKTISGRTNSKSYRSNKPYSFGVGMYLFELGVELAFAIPLDEKSKNLYGESDARDIQLNIYGKKWGIDAYHQKYEGFYITDPNIHMPTNVALPQRKDIETTNNGVSVNYVFNNKKFSFRSAYNFAERQLQSSGSFLLFASLSSFKAYADSAIIGRDYINQYGDGALIQKIKTTALGVAPGYTYSLIHSGFFLNGTLAFGPSYNWLFYQNDDGVGHNNVKFNSFVTARLSIGYNGDRFFGGMSFISQGRSVKFDNVQLNSSNGTFKILFGYRFREFGILKHRVWDLPKTLVGN